MGAFREGLMLVKETALGVPTATPVIGTDAVYVRLDKDNGYKGMSTPEVLAVMAGGGLGQRGFSLSDKTLVGGAFDFLLTWTQLKFLLSWCAIPQASPARALASMSIYHYVERLDGTARRRRLAGMNVAEWQLSGADSAEGRMVRLSGKAIGTRPYKDPYDNTTSDPDSAEFPLPTPADLPTDVVVFSDLGRAGSSVKVGAERKAKLSSLAIKSTNKLDPRWWTGRFAQHIGYMGRDASMDLKYALEQFTDEDAYELVTAQDVEVILSNGTQTCKIDFNGKNVIDPLDQDLVDGKVYDRSCTIVNQYDAAVGSGIAVTFTP